MSVLADHGTNPAWAIIAALDGVKGLLFHHNPWQSGHPAIPSEATSILALTALTETVWSHFGFSPARGNSPPVLNRLATRNRPSAEDPEYIIRKRRIKVVRYGELAGGDAELASLGAGMEWHPLRDRLAGFGNDDFLARLGLFDEPGQMGLGFVDTDGSHEFRLD